MLEEVELKAQGSGLKDMQDRRVPLYQEEIDLACDVTLLMISPWEAACRILSVAHGWGRAPEFPVSTQ